MGPQMLSKAAECLTGEMILSNEPLPESIPLNLVGATGQQMKCRMAKVLARTAASTNKFIIN
jgi:hypothetical protein